MSIKKPFNQQLTRSIGKGWIIAGGTLSIIIGLFAIVYQETATIVLEQFQTS